MGAKKSPSGRSTVLCSSPCVGILFICVLRIRIALVIIRSLITLTFFLFYWGGRAEGNKGVDGMMVEEGLTKLGDWNYMDCMSGGGFLWRIC